MGLKIMRRGDMLHVTGTFLRVRVRESTGYDKKRPAQALVRLHSIEKGIASGSYASRGPAKFVSLATFQDVADSYLRWKTTEGRLSRGMVGQMKRFGEYWGDKLAREITTSDVMDWVRTDMAGLKPGSVKRYLTTFKAMMGHARTRGWVAERISIPMPRVDDARDQHFDEIEATEFLAWVGRERPLALLAFTVLIDAGLRLGEAIRLNWSDVKFAKGFLSVRKKINGKSRGRQVPMSDALRELLVEARGAGSRPVLVTTRGQRWGDSSAASGGLGVVLRAGCEALGYERIRVHDLRHTFAFLAAMAGADLGDLQQMMGHERLDMTLRYRGFMPNRSVDVIKKLRIGCVSNV